MSTEFSDLQAILQSYPPFRELLFICSSNSKGVYLKAFDLSNDAVLRTYKSETGSGGEASCFCLAGSDYILCALKHKPLIFVWRTNWEHVHLRIACTGLVNAMACDPGAIYCTGAIADKINIWEISSGHLLAQLARHYQSVTTLHFTPDGHHFLSGGGDSVVITWNLAKVLSEQRLSHSKTEDSHSPRPLTEARSYTEYSQGSAPYLRVWSDHSMGISDITSSGEDRDCLRIFTCSLDMSCKIYDFASGSLLATYLFRSPLTCMRVSTDNMWFYTGASNGIIEATPLFLPTSNQVVDKASNCPNSYSYTLNSHSKAITGMGFSADGHLVSSSVDGSSTVWDIQSKQVLRSIKHKAPVVGMVMIKGDMTLSSSTQPSFTLNKHFGKQLSYTRDSFKHEVAIKTGSISILSESSIESLNKNCGDDVVSRFSFQPTVNCTISDEDVNNSETSSNEKLTREMKELQCVNKKMYAFAMERLSR